MIACNIPAHVIAVAATQAVLQRDVHSFMHDYEDNHLDIEAVDEVRIVIDDLHVCGSRAQTFLLDELRREYERREEYMLDEHARSGLA